MEVVLKESFTGNYVNFLAMDRNGCLMIGVAPINEKMRESRLRWFGPKITIFKGSPKLMDEERKVYSLTITLYSIALQY